VKPIWFNTPQLAAAVKRHGGKVLIVTKSFPIFEAKILFWPFNIFKN
jgi:hypothetical protein